jgi:HNH endonuclease
MTLQDQNRERDARAVALFLKLGSTRLVMDEMGISQKTLYYILHREGIATPRDGRIHNPYSACERNREKVLRMCAEGCSLLEMASAVGTNGREVKKFLRRNGETKEFSHSKIGNKHYAWKGRSIDKDGYVLIHQKGHPNARKHSHWIFEHRLVMEAHLGRILLPNEVIHHLDGVKTNNAIENLQLFQSNGEHLAVDLAGRCPKWSPEGRERIRKSTLRRWQNKRNANPVP